jgi:DNA-binding transcriptional LysR family regulator
VKRVGTPAFGLYGSRDYLARHPIDESAFPVPARHVVAWGDPLSFIAVSKALQAWTRSGAATPTVDSMQAIRSGAGIGVLPCILADAEGALIRVNPKLCRQDEPIWLVVHNDIRGANRVRVVCQFLEAIVKERRSALIGETV